jgi:hypothetical protein
VEELELERNLGKRKSSFEKVPQDFIRSTELDTIAILVVLIG